MIREIWIKDLVGGKEKEMEKLEDPMILNPNTPLRYLENRCCNSSLWVKSIRKYILACHLTEIMANTIDYPSATKFISCCAEVSKKYETNTTQ